MAVLATPFALKEKPVGPGELAFGPIRGGLDGRGLGRRP
jgi:hypothetical protein